MGVDWIPCRVEADSPKEELCELVRREALHFRTGGWAKRPEVVACRDEVLAAPILTLPAPPRWPVGGGEADLTAAERAFAKVESSVSAWNRAVQRGNVKLRLPRRPLPFEEWIAA